MVLDFKVNVRLVVGTTINFFLLSKINLFLTTFIFKQLLKML